MRAYLVETVNDAVRGHSAPMHDEVKAQSGGWQMLVYWGQTPKTLNFLGKSYNAIVLVDVPNHSGISSGYGIPMDFADKPAFVTFLQETQVSSLPAPIRNKLNNSGFDITGTIYQAMQDIM